MKLPESIKNLTSKDTFTIILWCTAGFYIPVAIIFALLALFDIVPANLNGQHYVGIKGFSIEILTVPIFTFLLTAAQWVVLSLGLKIIKWCAKLLNIQ